MPVKTFGWNDTVSIMAEDQVKTGVVKKKRGPPLFALFVILVTYFLWIDPRELPDYEAYDQIFKMSMLGRDWEIFFIFVNFYFRQMGFSYPEFRVFLLVFCSSALWLALSNIKPAESSKSISVRATNLFLIFFILAVFIFEYFVIRIRAGFAIGIISCSIYFLFASRAPFRRILAIILLVLAFYTHQFTTVILVIFLGVPLLASLWKGQPLRKPRLYILASAGIVAYMLYVLNSSYEIRGENVYSELNPVRFIMLSIVPLFMFFLTKNESSIPLTSGGSITDFPNYFIRFYAVLAIGLSLMYFSGMTVKSGEAIVRLYTLASIPSILSLKIAGSPFRSPVCTYILVINALFFLATVFMPG